MATEGGSPGTRPAILIAVEDGAEDSAAGAVASLDTLNPEHLPVHVVAPVSVGRRSVGDLQLGFWETSPVEFYWCVDPWIRFIRPLRTSDLMAAPGLPYAFLTEAAERLVDPQTERAAVQARERLREIRAEVGLRDERPRLCPGGGLLSTRVLRSFRDDFLVPRGWTYSDALARVPDALGWYTSWLEKAHPEAFVAREPIVLALASPNDLMRQALRRARPADLARSYVAVSVPPPWTLAEAAPGIAIPRYRLVAQHAGPGELLKAAWLRIYRQLPSLQRLVARLPRRGR